LRINIALLPVTFFSLSDIANISEILNLSERMNLYKVLSPKGLTNPAKSRKNQTIPVIIIPFLPTVLFFEVPFLS
jgi:hypothetical protein